MRVDGQEVLPPWTERGAGGGHGFVPPQSTRPSLAQLDAFGTQHPNDHLGLSAVDGLATHPLFSTQQAPQRTTAQKTSTACKQELNTREEKPKLRCSAGSTSQLSEGDITNLLKLSQRHGLRHSLLERLQRRRLRQPSRRLAELRRGDPACALPWQKNVYVGKKS